jgi:hypothetical protein
MLVKYVTVTKKARDSLYPLVRGEIEQEKERERAQAEASRLAAEAEAEAAERAAKVDAEAKRLSTFRATLSGGAWIVNGLGQSNVARGLHVKLLPSHTSMGSVRDVLKRVRDYAVFTDGAYETLAKNARGPDTPIEGVTREMAFAAADSGKAVVKLAERTLALADNHPVDMRGIYATIRTLGFRGKRMDGVLSDEFWPELVSSYALREATTNIDGKYRLEDVGGGHYYLYARHSTDRSVAEWMIPVLIDKSEPVECDIYNEKASLIFNKGD